MMRSACGCTWERRPGVGDVVVVQCLSHAAAGRTPRAKRAKAAADLLVKRMREEGRIR